MTELNGIPLSERTADLLSIPVWMLTQPLIVNSVTRVFRQPHVRSVFYELDVDFGWSALLKPRGLFR